MTQDELSDKDIRALTWYLLMSDIKIEAHKLLIKEEKKFMRLVLKEISSREPSKP